MPVAVTYPMRSSTKTLAGASKRQSGVALIIVLWVLVLVTITVGSFSVSARTENLQARQLLDGTRARYAAEAGIAMAVLNLRNPDIANRWVPDGRVYTLPFEDANLEISIIDERGKLDLNVVDELTLGSLLIGVGIDEMQVLPLVAAILDWRDPDDAVRLNGAEDAEYGSADLPYGPRNGNFVILDELQQVLGMNYDLYRKLEPALTVYSRRRTIDPAFAPFEALMVMPGMTEDIARDFINQRESRDNSGDNTLLMPDGSAVAMRGIGPTQSVSIKATMPSGVWERLEVTISLSPGKNQQAFQIMRWKEGVWES
ncbi:MAG: type II secretion system protein GspK [Xanthomonadales bacterium]|nr:type II secretion system protein GspK [Xanthomonadales bacterium]